MSHVPDRSSSPQAADPPVAGHELAPARRRTYVMALAVPCVLMVLNLAMAVINIPHALPVAIASLAALVSALTTWAVVDFEQRQRANLQGRESGIREQLADE